MAEPHEREWVRAVALGELERGKTLRIEVGGRGVAIFHLEDGTFRALEDACPHAGFPLHQGDVEGHQVTCPLHNWVLSLDDGRCLFGSRPARAYECRVEGGWLSVAPLVADSVAQVEALAQIHVAVATSTPAALPKLIEFALAAALPVQDLLELARAASTAELLPAMDALSEVLAVFPSIPEGEVALSALELAARAEGWGPAPERDAPSRPLAPERLHGESGDHLRRRLVAALEKQDTAGACEAALAYLEERHTPVYLAQDLLRAALKSHPALLPEAVRLGISAYRWRADDMSAIDALLGGLTAAGPRDATAL